MLKVTRFNIEKMKHLFNQLFFGRKLNKVNYTSLKSRAKDGDAVSKNTALKEKLESISWNNCFSSSPQENHFHITEYSHKLKFRASISAPVNITTGCTIFVTSFYSAIMRIFCLTNASYPCWCSFCYPYIR